MAWASHKGRDAGNVPHGVICLLRRDYQGKNARLGRIRNKLGQNRTGGGWAAALRRLPKAMEFQIVGRRRLLCPWPKLAINWANCAINSVAANVMRRYGEDERKRCYTLRIAMKHRDRVFTALDHQPPDRCPMQISFTPEFAARLRAAMRMDGSRPITRTAAATPTPSNSPWTRTCC